MAMWRLPILLIITLLFCLLLAPAVPQLQAQTADPPITTNTATLHFPDEVAFHLEVATGAPVVDAVLTYDVDRFSCLEAASQVPVEVEGDTIEWTWVMSRSGNPPPGAELWWQWTLTDANGSSFTTPRQTLTFDDGRFDWRVVSAEGISLHWYEGDEVGSLLLDAAVAGLGRLENDMGIELQDDVQLYIYGDSQEMRQAVLYIQDWAGGVAFSEYNTILMGVPPEIAESWGRSTIRHELAHLVIGQFGRSCVGGRRPNWLEEGLAVYAEGEPQPGVVSDLEAAISANSLEPLRSLNGAFSAHGPEAGAAYSQSYSVVAFLLEEYGQGKMQELLLVLAEGEGYDEALQQVYGFNVDGLETAWRAMIGAAERPIPPTPTPILAANIPTLAPMGAPANVPTPPAAAEPPPNPSPSSGVCNLALIPLLLIGLAGYKRRTEGGK